MRISWYSNGAIGHRQLISLGNCEEKRESFFESSRRRAGYITSLTGGLVSEVVDITMRTVQ